MCLSKKSWIPIELQVESNHWNSFFSGSSTPSTLWNTHWCPSSTGSCYHNRGTLPHQRPKNAGVTSRSMAWTLLWCSSNLFLIEWKWFGGTCLLCTQSRYFICSGHGLLNWFSLFYRDCGFYCCRSQRFPYFFVNYNHPVNAAFILGLLVFLTILYVLSYGLHILRRRIFLGK